MVRHVFQRSNIELSGLIIPGSTPNSDLSASVGYIKNQKDIFAILKRWAKMLSGNCKTHREMVVISNK